MDANRFDNLLRLLAASPSRRNIGRGLAGLTLAGPLSTLFGVEDAAARNKKRKRKKRKKKCKGATKKCGKKCIPAANCCSDASCGGGATCQNGVCTCPAGQEDCNGACILTGDCCPACTGGNVCNSGECVCPGGTTLCGDECIDEFACCMNADCGGGILICVDGDCVCPDVGDIPCTIDECCDVGANEVCQVGSGCVAGGCPATDVCNGGTRFNCGEECICLTSVNGVNVCTSFVIDVCNECAADAECGEGSVCVSLGTICLCDEIETAICVPIGCPSNASLRGRSGGAGRARESKLKIGR